MRTFSFPWSALAFLLAVPSWAQLPDIGTAPQLPAGYQAPPFSSRSVVTPEALSWIDTSSRAVVQQSYLTTFAPAKSVLMGWVGDVAAGNAGTTSQAYKDAVALRINWLRALAGINSNVTLDSTWNSQDQQAALMMSANNQLNHNPPAVWQFYSAAGATAAGNSNLCLGFSPNDPGCLELYMQDHGSSNTFAGHRRWILYPQSVKMGTGDIPPTFGYLSANALWVIDMATFGGTRPATRDAFVAWPPKGYVPYQLVYPRWSFSYAGANFTNATVSMQRYGLTVPVRLEAVANGYGENTLVWVPDNLDANQYITPANPGMDITTTVTVSNVYINGSARSFTYDVTVFDPAVTPSNATYSFNPASATVGSAGGTGSATLTITPAGSGYQAMSSASWLTFSAGSGAGSATISYTVAPNPSGSSRTAQIMVGNAAFTVTQAGVPCTYAVSPTSVTVSMAGEAQTVSVTPSAAGCPWTASSNAAWLTITAGASGAGAGTVSYNAAANTGAPRTGTLTVAGQSVTITQSLNLLATQLGIFRGSGQGGVLWVRDRNGDGQFTGGTDTAVGNGVLGVAGDVPVIGDWSGSGTKKLGVFRPFGSTTPVAGVFVLDYDGNEQWNPPADKALWFPAIAGDIPVVGHWNGGTQDRLGIFRQGVFYLDGNGDGSFTKVIIMGATGDVPMIGDWNGDGRSKVGVYRNGLWVLDYNGNGQWDGPTVDKAFYLGTAGDQPVVGDWNGDGKTKAGVFRKSAGLWVLDYNGNGQWDGTSTDRALFNGFDTSNDVGVVGDWTGNGKAKAGVFHGATGTWFLDVLGDGGFGRLAYLGQAGDTPVVGKW